jgi:transposase
MAARLGICMWCAESSLTRKKKAPDVKMDDHNQKLNTAIIHLYNRIGTTDLKGKNMLAEGHY